MAGNSVPLFIGSNKNFLPPSLDITTVIDYSGSMAPYGPLFYNVTRYSELNSFLQNRQIGIASSRPNKYSFCVTSSTGSETLATLERAILVNGVNSRWVTGENFNNGLPVSFASIIFSGGVENFIYPTNLVSSTDRDYNPLSTRVIFALSDASNASTLFNDNPLFPYRYVCVHSVIFSYVGGADQGPNPIPAGTWVGFFYETDTIGTAIYIDGTTINYRREVPIASVTNNSVNPTLLRSIETARTTRGAFYNITQFNSTARVTQLFESFSEIIKDNLTLA